MIRRVLIAALLASTSFVTDARALVWPDVPERVEKALASTDPATRRTAAKALTSLGRSRATPLVLHALTDADDAVRLAAADSAIRLGVSEATGEVLPWLGGASLALRIAACDVARALPDPRATPQLARALGDAEATVRAAAADALGSYASDADAVPPLLGKLDDSSPNVRVVIARSLARLGDPRAVAPLVGKAQDSVPEVRQAVARALGQLGDKRAVQALALALHDGSIDVRVEALGALGRLRADGAVDAIAPLVHDRSALVRQAAIAALGRIGGDAAVRALVSVLGSGDDASAGVERSAVREALVAVGPSAIGDVAAVLDGFPSPSAAASAAWILGELHAEARAPAIVAAMRRGALAPAAGLHALAGAGASSGTTDVLPVVLEFTGDANPLVRGEALRATAALLDPSKPDGRAVEPLAAALRDARYTDAERVQIASLLGRTGAARAAAPLAGLAKSHDVALRLAAIDALATLGPVAATRAEDTAPLVDALGDADAAVRLHAAVALAETGGAHERDELVAKLDADDEIDRAALFTALAGVLARAPSDAAVARVAREVDLAAGADRDGALDAVGRVRAPSAVAVLSRVAREGDVDDRREVAVLLAAHAGDAASVALARSLLSDGDASVRAQAAWSLGTIGDASTVPLLQPLVRDEGATSIDASAAIGRIAARAHAPQIAAQALCARIAEAHAAPYVRASALAALSIAHARCGDGATERHALDDPHDAVRAAAALAIGRAPLGEADRRALDACTTSDRSGSIARTCRAPSPIPTTAHATLVYVVPDLETRPRPGAPYVLRVADGSLRAGTADRRGAALDPVAPEGDLSLLRATER